MRQENGTDLLGLDDPRSQSIGIIYVSPDDDRKSILHAIITQARLGRKFVVVVLPNQSAAFQRLVDFDELKKGSHKLSIQIIIIADSMGSGRSVYYARQCNFLVYSSLETFKISLQSQDVPFSVPRIEKRTGPDLSDPMLQKSLSHRAIDVFPVLEQSSKPGYITEEPPLDAVSPLSQTLVRNRLAFRALSASSPEDRQNKKQEEKQNPLVSKRRVKKDKDHLPLRLQDQLDKSVWNKQIALDKIESDLNASRQLAEQATNRLSEIIPASQTDNASRRETSISRIPTTPQAASDASLYDDQQPILHVQEDPIEDRESAWHSVVIDHKTSKKRNASIKPVVIARPLLLLPRSQKRKRRLWWMVAIICVVVLLSGGGTIWAYSQGLDLITIVRGSLVGGIATVDITPASKDINQDYVVTLSDTPLPNTMEVATHHLEGKQDGSKSLDAKGHAKTEPATAKGSFLFCNFFFSDFVLVANTDILGPNAVHFYTDEAVSIPKGQIMADNSEECGKAIISAHAASVGINGNLEANKIKEQMCCVEGNHIMIINNTAFTGGQDGKDYNYVLQDDYDNAVTQIKQDTEAKARSAVQSLKQGNEAFAADITCESKDSSDQPIGDKGLGVVAATVSVNSTCKAVVYDKQAMTKLITQKLQEQAAKDAGAGYVLKGEPTIDSHVQTENTPLTVQVASKGQWVYQFTDQDKQEITQLIAGKTVVEAKAILALRTGVKLANVTYSGGRLPSDLSLITIRIKDMRAAQDKPTIQVGTVLLIGIIAMAGVALGGRLIIS